MFADPATCGTYTTQNDNVYLQQNPAYELVYPVRPNMNMYQQWADRSTQGGLSLQKYYT